MYQNILIPITDGKKVYNVSCNLKEAYESGSKALVKAFEKAILLHTIDEDWKEHLREMDELRHSVQNASYEQKDPLLIYKLESFNLFRTMVSDINSKAVSVLMRGRYRSRILLMYGRLLRSRRPITANTAPRRMRAVIWQPPVKVEVQTHNPASRKSWHLCGWRRRWAETNLVPAAVARNSKTATARSKSKTVTIKKTGGNKLPVFFVKLREKLYLSILKRGLFVEIRTV